MCHKTRPKIKSYFFEKLIFLLPLKLPNMLQTCSIFVTRISFTMFLNVLNNVILFYTGREFFLILIMHEIIQVICVTTYFCRQYQW